MKVELPIDVDWEMAEEIYPGRSMSEVSGQVDRAVRSVIDSCGLSKVFSVGVSKSSEASHVKADISPDLHEAGKLWKCHNDEVLKSLLVERITWAVDACLRAIGIGGVEGYAPSWTRFYGQGQDDCADDVVGVCDACGGEVSMAGPDGLCAYCREKGVELCPGCGHPMIEDVLKVAGDSHYSIHEQDDIQERIECSECYSSHLCTECMVWHEEMPYCPDCVWPGGVPDITILGFILEVAAEDLPDLGDKIYGYDDIGASCVALGYGPRELSIEDLDEEGRPPEHVDGDPDDFYYDGPGWADVQAEQETVVDLLRDARIAGHPVVHVTDPGCMASVVQEGLDSRDRPCTEDVLEIGHFGHSGACDCWDKPGAGAGGVYRVFAKSNLIVAGEFPSEAFGTYQLREDVRINICISKQPRNMGMTNATRIEEE